MTFKSLASVLAIIAGLSASPALAQSNPDDGFTGVYIGGSIGKVFQSGDEGSTILFDTDQDGDFSDMVLTTGSMDAFSPGFCGGAANTNAPAGGCADDGDGVDYFVNLGYDKQMGNLVFGIVGEFGKVEIDDSTTGFSTTPASYTFTRSLDYTGGLRLRAGYTPNGSTLIYGTGGAAYGKIENSFTTTNGANSFTGNGDSDAWGWSAGAGIEQKIGSNFSIGLQYLHTDLKDDDYVVRVGPGTAGPTNPFLLVDPTGTDIRRSDDNFRYNSVRATAAFRF